MASGVAAGGGASHGGDGGQRDGAAGKGHRPGVAARVAGQVGAGLVAIVPLTVSVSQPSWPRSRHWHCCHRGRNRSDRHASLPVTATAPLLIGRRWW